VFVAYNECTKLSTPIASFNFLGVPLDYKRRALHCKFLLLTIKSFPLQSLTRLPTLVISTTLACHFEGGTTEKSVSQPKGFSFQSLTPATI